jgi:TolB-like protein/class 3 adenylate cyclase
MTQEGFKRKLAAILSADAVGYSRLMAEDEAATVKTIASYREIMVFLIKQHRGRVVDSPGDNLLAEFASVVDAVQCAVAVQNEFQTRNAELDKNRRMEFRIGINLGDVIDEKDRIYGDGVNVAARLEALAEPGGICVSKTAFDQIETKLPFVYEYLGEQSVKNIPKPVGAYRVLMQPRVTVAGEQESKKTAHKRRITIIGGVVALILVAAVVGIWQFYMQRPSLKPASIEKMAFPLPDKPSIAVLPFTNMSGDPEQEYFCDGITEDLITDLSKITNLFVIARNSAFTYKGRAIKLSQVAEDLGVRYILEGSVRRHDNQVRINAQLIDALTGGHLWAERYDNNMINVFELQDIVNKKIVTALAVKLTAADEGHLLSKDTLNIEAYDIFLKGMSHYRNGTIDDIKLSISYLEKSIELDPNYSKAYAALAAVYMRVYSFGGESLVSGINEYKPRLRAEELIQLSMKHPTSLSFQIAAVIQIEKRMYDSAIDYAKQSIDLSPNDPESYYALAYCLAYAGKAEESLNYIDKAMRFDPYFPPNYLYVRGIAFFTAEKYREAAASFERLLIRNPDFTLAMPFLIASYSYLDKVNKAKEVVNSYSARYSMEPIFLLGTFQIYTPFKESKDLDRVVKGFQKAIKD